MYAANSGAETGSAGLNTDLVWVLFLLVIRVGGYIDTKMSQKLI